LPALSFGVIYYDMKSASPPRLRPYRQVARAEAAEATAQRIVEAFAERMRDGWFDEITLEEVARRAGVTVRTVIRRFGGKEGLLQAFADRFIPQANRRRDSVPGDAAAAVARVLDLYEDWGDGFVRLLAQQARHPALKPLLDRGRREHRATTAAAYAPWLDRLPQPRRRRTLDALVAATDLYVWQLLRRDLGRSRREAEIVMGLLVAAVLGDAGREPARSRGER
jgi:AcrR family transcriptional regulator